jgi:hypothetical protein
LIHAEQRNWTATADTLAGPGGASSCLERSLQRSRRSSTHWLATSSFNSAVAYFNLSRTLEARLHAAKVADDEQFGERVKTMLDRLGPRP